MPKSKKAKTSHAGNFNGIKADRNLTHDEIWDDSALLRSWEAAVEEYKYYHSLAAQGLDIEAVLDDAEAAEANGEPLPLALDDAAGQNRQGQVATRAEPDNDEVEEGELEDEPSDRPPTAEERDSALRRAGLQFASSSTAKDLITNDTQPSTERGQHKPSQAAQPATSVVDQGPPDQTLENLKMAYYWAGYYSGLYDGQRQSGSKPAP